jgi:hypothetical protein
VGDTVGVVTGAGAVTVGAGAASDVDGLGVTGADDSLLASEDGAGAAVVSATSRRARCSSVDALARAPWRNHHASRIPRAASTSSPIRLARLRAHEVMLPYPRSMPVRELHRTHPRPFQPWARREFLLVRHTTTRMKKR